MAASPDRTCVICKEFELIEGVESKFRPDRSMTRSKAKFRDMEVICFTYVSPPVPYPNKWATTIMGCKIVGDAILMAKPSGITAAQVRGAQPKTWANIAHALPAFVPETKKEAPPTPPPKDRWDFSENYDDGPLCGDGNCDGTCYQCEDLSNAAPVYDYMDDTHFM